MQSPQELHDSIATDPVTGPLRTFLGKALLPFSLFVIGMT